MSTSEIDPIFFRSAMGALPTGVTIVTAVAAGRPVGLSVNSFTSVSLDPALVAFCVSNTSSTWPHVRAVGTFCVNILEEGQEALSRTFASRGPDRFLGVGWRPSPSGSPLLADVLAWVDCTVEVEHQAGDHLMVLARAHDLGVVREGRPLIFYRGGYGRFEP